MNLAAMLFNKPFIPQQGTIRVISHMHEVADEDESKTLMPAKVVKEKSIRGKIMNTVDRHGEVMFSVIQEETGFTEKSVRQTVCDLKKKGLLNSQRINGHREYRFFLTRQGKRWIDEFNAMDGL